MKSGVKKWIALEGVLQSLARKHKKDWYALHNMLLFIL
jgi:hypothetical protein